MNLIVNLKTYKKLLYDFIKKLKLLIVNKVNI